MDESMYIALSAGTTYLIILLVIKKEAIGLFTFKLTVIIALAVHTKYEFPVSYKCDNGPITLYRGSFYTCLNPTKAIFYENIQSGFSINTPHQCIEPVMLLQ